MANRPGFDRCVAVHCWQGCRSFLHSGWDLSNEPPRYDANGQDRAIHLAVEEGQPDSVLAGLHAMNQSGLEPQPPWDTARDRAVPLVHPLSDQRAHRDQGYQPFATRCAGPARYLGWFLALERNRFVPTPPDHTIRRA